MLNDPDRGAIKRKWAVSRDGGPTVFFAEQVQKKLIAHYWPCTYDWYPETGTIVFRPIKGRRFAGSFLEQMHLAMRIIAVPCKVQYQTVGYSFRLVGQYEITKQGKLRPCSSQT